MPIEIKELHVRINVDESSSANTTGATTQQMKEQIVAVCVERVMGILSKKEER